MKTEIIYGIHPVRESLRAGRRHIYEVYLDKEKKSAHFSLIKSMATSRHVPLKLIGANNFSSLINAAGHQGAAARVGGYPQITVADIFKAVEAREDQPFLLMLDNLQDPQNLGAIIRTAVCVGIDGIILPKDRCVSPTPAVCKASAGALEHVRLSRVTNLVQTIKFCKDRGLWIMGLDGEAGQSIYASDLTGAVALVLGGEQKGLRPVVKKNCDFLISIPQQGPIDSLNASVAAAIAMYESYRQKAKADRGL